MRKKQFYEAPEAEALAVKFEKAFLQDSPQDDTFSANGYRDEYNYRDLN